MFWYTHTELMITVVKLVYTTISSHSYHMGLGCVKPLQFPRRASWKPFPRVAAARCVVQFLPSWGRTWELEVIAHSLCTVLGGTLSFRTHGLSHHSFALSLPEDKRLPGPISSQRTVGGLEACVHLWSKYPPAVSNSQRTRESCFSAPGLPETTWLEEADPGDAFGKAGHERCGLALPGETGSLGCTAGAYGWGEPRDSLAVSDSTPCSLQTQRR